MVVFRVSRQSLVIIWFLLGILISLPVQAADISSCKFDSYFMGEIESIIQSTEGYQIELLAGGDSMKYLVRKDAPEYFITNHTVQEMRKTKEMQEGAFLLQNNAICGFTPAYRDEVVIFSHNFHGSRYTMSVCTDETSNCYTLRVSSGNPLFSQLESIIAKVQRTPVIVEFSHFYEILGIVPTENFAQSNRTIRPNKFGEKFGDRVRTDNEEWLDKRYTRIWPTR